jgi:phage antirepressor YoqD-like protein
MSRRDTLVRHVARNISNYGNLLGHWIRGMKLVIQLSKPRISYEQKSLSMDVLSILLVATTSSSEPVTTKCSISNVALQNSSLY